MKFCENEDQQSIHDGLQYTGQYAGNEQSSNGFVGDDRIEDERKARGYQLGQRARGHKASGGQTPVIVQTQHRFPGDGGKGYQPRKAGAGDGPESGISKYRRQGQTPRHSAEPGEGGFVKIRADAGTICKIPHQYEKGNTDHHIFGTGAPYDDRQIAQRRRQAPYIP